MINSAMTISDSGKNKNDAQFITMKMLWKGTCKVIKTKNSILNLDVMRFVHLQ